MAAAWAAAGVITSVIGGIWGGAQASNANSKQEEYLRKQEERLQKIADITNEWQKKDFEATKQNWHDLADYNFETAMKAYNFGRLERSLQFKTDAQKYLMNVQNSNQQLTFNELAAAQAQTREQMALDQVLQEDRFARQDLLVEQLQQTGKARLGQAGRSMNKGVQATQAQIGRDLAVLDASLTGEIQASNLRMFDVSLGKYAADARVEAARMLRPSLMPDPPLPTRPPEPNWVEPPEVLPGMAPLGTHHSVAGPMISGISSGLSGMASIKWNSPNSGGAFSMPTIGAASQGVKFNPDAFSMPQLAGGG